ncbi:unnamed protein product [Lymnaea stagnalis]|uniref:C3H1-type domain-containing protein n=1 Tax=Lymnaea stagnalis TaxID=6523 RepID=A0AAV2I701_LYMST
MGKRYYCDYCDKSFADNPTSRKVHLTGNAHLLTKKLHYDAYRNEKEILEEDQNKKPCRAFLSTGQCKFGDRCQFSHLTNEDRMQLSQILKQKEERSGLGQAVSTPTDVRDKLHQWLDNRKQRKKFESSDKETNVKKPECELKVPDYKLAECLTVFPSLPPSLLPPSKESILTSPFVTWG